MARSTDDRRSRYIQGGTTEILPTRLGWWDKRLFAKDPTDVEFTITSVYHQRADKLSTDMYGTDKYEFAIYQYNGILDIMEEFVEGNTILLPTKIRMSMDLMSKTK